MTTYGTHQNRPNVPTVIEEAEKIKAENFPPLDPQSQKMVDKFLDELSILTNEKEVFNIWFGSGILQATRIPSDHYIVVWRKEPDGKDRFEY